MKPSKIIILAVIVAALIMLALASTEAAGETPIFKDYQVAEVQPFEVPLNVAAPASAGRELADEIGFNVRQMYRVYIPNGCPHNRDDSRHLWINGLEFRNWIYN